MADDRLEKIRQTVKKMVAGGESEEDIDLFLRSKGVSPRQLAAHNRVDKTIKELDKQMQLRRVGTGAGLVQAWEGFKSIFFDDKSPEEERRVYEAAKAQESPENQMAMGQGEFIGESAPYAAIPAAGAGASLPVRLGAATAGGAGIGFSQYQSPGEDELRNRIGNTGAGVIAAGATALGLEPVRIASGRASNPQLSAKDRAITDLGDQHNVPLSYGDVRGGAAAQAESVMQEIPVVGLGRFRRKQQIFSEQSAKEQLGKRPASPQGQSGTDAFGRPIFTGWQVDAQQSIKTRLAAVKRKESALYKKAADVADPHGAMKMDNTLAEIDALIAEEAGKVKPNQKFIEIMQQERKVIAEAVSGRKTKFSNTHEYRAELNDEIDSFYTGKNELLPKSDVKAYVRIKKAVDRDMEVFTKSIGSDAYNAWKLADGFHSARVAPYREEALLRHLASEKDPVALYDAFLNGLRSNPQTVYTSLGKKGQAAVRAGLLDDAFKKSYDEKVGFDPVKFGQILKDRQREIGVVFKGTDKAEIDGFIKLMQHLDNAGEFVNRPRVQSRVQSMSIAAGAGAVGFFSPLIAGGSATAVAFLSKLFSSKAGRDFLLSSNKAKPGPQMQKIIDYYAPRLAAVEAAEEE